MKLYGISFHNEGYLTLFIAASHDLDKLKGLIPTVTWRDGSVPNMCHDGPIICYGETASPDHKYTIRELSFLI